RTSHVRSHEAHRCATAVCSRFPFYKGQKSGSLKHKWAPESFVKSSPMGFNFGAMSRRHALSRPKGVVVRAEGKTPASGSTENSWRHCWINARVVEDNATVRCDRSLLGRSSLPR